MSQPELTGMPLHYITSDAKYAILLNVESEVLLMFATVISDINWLPGEKGSC